MKLTNGLDPAPLVEHIRDKKLSHQEMLNLGLDSSYFRRMETGKVKKVSVDVADRVITYTGGSLSLLYPAFNVEDLPEVRAICPKCDAFSYFQQKDNGWVCDACNHTTQRRPFNREGQRTIPQEAVTEYFSNPDITMAELAEKYGCRQSSLWERISLESMPRRGAGGRNTGVDKKLLRTIGFEGIAQRANEMREEGGQWSDIAKALGYSSGESALKAAKRYRNNNYSQQRRTK